MEEFNENIEKKLEELKGLTSEELGNTIILKYLTNLADFMYSEAIKNLNDYISSLETRLNAGSDRRFVIIPFHTDGDNDLVIVSKFSNESSKIR